MIKIGLTGGIGSGKSTIAFIFNKLGIPVYCADDRAKFLMLNNKLLRESIIDLFGKKVYSYGSMNMAYIASKVFTNNNNLVKLNKLVHPFVKNDFDIWVDSQISPYVIKEAAILIETGSNKLLDKIILIESPKEFKIRRVMMRDRLSKEEVLLRMSKQFSDKQKRKFADYIIINDEKSSLIKQVIKIHNFLSQK